MFRQSVAAAIGLVSLASLSPVLAHQGDSPDSNTPNPAQSEVHPTPYLIVNRGLQAATIRHTGERVLLEGGQVWRPMCGSDMSQITVDDLAQIRDQTMAAAQSENVIVIDNTSPARGSGLNIIFTLDSSVPAAAVDAIATAEAFIESQFGDPVTVRMFIDFASLGGSTIGATGSNDVNINWSTARNALIAGKDGNDTIQDSLPTGSTIPVRYESESTAVTNENRVFFNTANYEATVGSIGGTDAFTTFNSNFNFDYDPSNGVNGTDFQSVLIHEVGHGLGFSSGTDFRPSDIETLDIYRFSRNDFVNGVNEDANPDTLAEFQTTARMVDPDDPGTSSDDTEVDANSDLISAEYRMADGFPNQASHFHEGLNGIMDPTLGSGQTFFPNFYRTSDLDMFDAIGYDYPPSAPASFAPVAPANGSLQPVTTMFQWEQSTSAASYTLTIDDNSNLASPVIQISTDQLTYTATLGTLNPSTTYYWSVEAENPIGMTTMNPSPQMFMTDVSPVGSFDLLLPENFASVTTTPTLTWTASPNATDYLVEVSIQGTFAFSIVSETTSNTEYTVLDGVLNPDTQYFWRVTAMNSGSSQISTPTARRFTTDFAPVNSCVYDINNTGSVDIVDFTAFAAAFNSMTGDPNYDPALDFNDTGSIDIVDFTEFSSEFGRTDCLD